MAIRGLGKEWSIFLTRKMRMGQLSLPIKSQVKMVMKNYLGLAVKIDNKITSFLCWFVFFWAEDLSKTTSIPYKDWIGGKIYVYLTLVSPHLWDYTGMLLLPLKSSIYFGGLGQIVLQHILEVVKNDKSTRLVVNDMDKLLIRLGQSSSLWASF